MRYAAALLVALACSGVIASDPGQPLDCSDWVFDQPGLSCTADVAFPCGGVGTDNTLAICSLGETVQADNEGGALYQKTVVLPPIDCGDGSGLKRFNRYELTRHRSGAEELVAHIQERCGSSAPDLLQPYGLMFDATRGTVQMGFRNFSGAAETGRQRMAINGFSTLFEVLQSYTPPASLAFRVPYMPEGMGGADRFDTYWGDLATVGDWSKAKGLQCGYPASPPKVGDYFTVVDALPTPAAGSGYYYVTATTYQGQTRYGRKSTAGHLSGRDPAVLPGCGQ